MSKLNENTSLTVNNTGLTLKEREVINELPSGLQIYVKAKDSIKVFEMAPVEAEIMLYDLIIETQINVGHTKAIDDREINQISAAAILNLIYQKHRTLTVVELKLAFLNGLSGDYGDYIGVNLKTASQWIRGYSDAEIKKKALTEWNKKLDIDKKPELTEAQKEEIELNSVCNYFNEFKVNYVSGNRDTMTDLLCSIFYLRLKEKNVFNFTKEQKSQMYETGLSEYKKALTGSRVSKNIYGAMLQQITKNVNNTFDHICKRIALHEYFKDLINKGIELKDVLNKN